MSLRPFWRIQSVVHKDQVKVTFCRLDAQGFVEIVSVLVGNGNKLFVVFLLLFF